MQLLSTGQWVSRHIRLIIGISASLAVGAASSAVVLASIPDDNGNTCLGRLVPLPPEE